jgi:DNA-binding CsgD family transcriptional regulator
MPVINDINFTSREFDILACLLNSRGTKKIAVFLNISARTVEAHLQNIMLKISCNSQEGIIDFLGKSDEYKQVKDHYLELLLKASFEQQLKKIAYLTKKLNLSCIIDDSDKNVKLTLLSGHLKLAGITVIKTIKEDSNTYLLYPIYQLAAIPSSLEEVMRKHIAKHGSLNLIFLAFEEDAYKAAVAEMADIRTIDFYNKEQYPFSVFKILKLLLPNIDFSRYISEFKKISSNIFNGKDIALDSLNAVVSNQSQSVGNIVNSELLSKTEHEVEQHLDSISDKTEKITKHPANKPNASAYNNKKAFFYILTGASAICLASLIIAFFSNISSWVTSTRDASSSPAEIMKKLDNIHAFSLSADNVTTEQISKNFAVIKQAEKVLAQVNQEGIQAYFNNSEISSEHFLNYLYLLQSIANYYANNEHNGIKARALLEQAKNLIENYINKRNVVKLDFAKLASEELYAELNITKDLPEMYTRILYSLGRTYIYQGDREEARKYFEAAKYLGNRLNLFEEHLSQRNGLGILEKDKIDFEIKNGNVEKVRQAINQFIELYKALKISGKEYKADYKPNTDKLALIIPKNDVHNQVECGKQIAEHYAKLINITESSDKITEYVKEISKQLAGDAKEAGLFTQLEQVSDRQVADTYNSVGSILLQLYDKKVDLEQLKTRLLVSNQLFLPNNQPNINKTTGALKVIEQIFDYARLRSRHNHFTKADAYDGLIRVYDRQIKDGNLTKAQLQSLSFEIAQLKLQRDNINKNLKRTPRT